MSENTAKRISISTQVAHRGRQLTISSEGYTADEFCDLLDRRFGPPQVTQTAPQASAPSCPVHGKPMKEMKYPSKTGQMWHCTTKVGDSWCDERA